MGRLAVVLILLGALVMGLLLGSVVALAVNVQQADPVWPTVCRVVQPEDLDR